jgi:hypothetical protein
MNYKGPELSEEFPLFTITEEKDFMTRKNHLVARAHHNGAHLVVKRDADGFELSLWGENEDGSIDSSKPLNDSYLTGQADDMEEVAHTFASRLASGISPEKMFTDIEEADRAHAKNLVEMLKKKK